MARYVNVGFNNAVCRDKVMAILTASSLPCKRLVQVKRDECKVLDSTAGNKLKTVIVLDNGYIMLSAINVSTIVGRLSHGDRESEENR